jgi:hypothetical protein
MRVRIPLFPAKDANGSQAMRLQCMSAKEEDHFLKKITNYKAGQPAGRITFFERSFCNLAST